MCDELTERAKVRLVSWQKDMLEDFAEEIGDTTDAVIRVCVMRLLTSPQPDFMYTNAIYEIGKASLILSGTYGRG